MEILWILTFLVLFLISYIAYAAHRDKEYFRSRNVYPISSSASLGMLKIIYQMSWHGMSIVQIVQKQYETIRQAGVKIVGNMEFDLINHTVIDLEMIKNILVKDFDHFVNRRKFTIPGNDPLMGKMLIFMKDEPWKGLRSKLSPTFTTGKIKKMFPLFYESSKKLVQYVDSRMEQSSSAGEIDLLEGYSKFTMDTIASAVCNMNSQAFDQVEPSRFEKMGQKLQLNFSPKEMISFIILQGFPKIAELFGITLFGREMYEFFSGAIKSSIREREVRGEKRNDFIQLMLEARQDKLKIDVSELNAFEKDAQIEDNSSSKSSTAAEMLDDDGIVSNSVLFILAGFDTTQSLLIFCAYALAIYPEIQEKLREEVDSVLDENDGDFTYESLHKMTYLDMVINETLRFYPPAPMTDRGCTQDYTILDGGKEITIKKGSGVIIPIIGLHHDERYFPEPSKFDPERFSAENKRKIPPYAFLPFGQGPRNCIGMRFALTEVKLAIAQLVHNFDIEPSAKTLIPMQFKSAGSLQPKEGMWLALKRRPGTKV